MARYKIPERFIVRSGLTVSGPTRVLPNEYGPGDVTHFDAVWDDEWVNYVMQLSDADIPAEPIPRTFRILKSADK